MGEPQSKGPSSMLTTYCRELASMASTLRDLLGHTVRRGLPVGGDGDAMLDLVAPLDALRAQLCEALGAAGPACRRSSDAHGESPAELLHHLGAMNLDLRGVRMSLDEVFDDGGFQQQGPRPFRRLVVEDLRDTFGVPKVVGDGEPQKSPLTLEVRDGTPAARRAAAAKSVPAEPPPSTPEEMLTLLRQTYGDVSVTMEGTTESLPIQTVFESLSASHKSGTLHIRTETETLVFELDRGDVVFAASDRTPAGDRLGDILFERGWVTATSLNAALGAQVDSQERLGSALEREQIVTREQLRIALEEQIHRHFLRAFQATRAAYAFARGNSEDVDQRVRLNIARLLFESARISDESARGRPVSKG